MSRRDMRRVDAIRRRSSEIQNHVIDHYVAGKMSRREFIRKGSIVGLSLPFMGVIAAACGDSGTTTTGAADTGAATTVAGTAGTTATTTAAGPTTVRVGMNNPAGVLDPVLINDLGRIQIFSQTAEYLTFSADDGLRPALAESWEPNEDGTVWTFTLRDGLLYHDGTPVSAEDVVATMDGIAGGNASSAFDGVWTPGNARAVDERTVEFTLDAPIGSFPFIVSSDNYNAGILPKSFWDAYAEGSYEQNAVGTGPWITESFENGVSAVLRKNEDYWGDNSAQPDRLEVTFFADEPAMITAFQEGRIDVLPSFSVANGGALLDNPEVSVQTQPTAEHRQIHMRTDREPFTDARVRQAVALSMNRAAIIEGLWEGFADLGNDAPIAPVHVAYDPSVAQREEDLQQANELIDAAGVRDAQVTLNVLEFEEVPLLAQLVQAAAAQIGINVNIQVDDAGTYYNNFWLDSTFGITNYGHRGVPNVYLSAALKSDGPWNAAAYQDADYDALVDTFLAEFDLDRQRELGGQITQKLLDDSPMGIPYFKSNLAAVQAGTEGLETTGMGHILLQDLQLG